MGIDKLKRVMWRLREKHPDLSYIRKTDLETAIMIECGTNPKTLMINIKSLLKLGWIKQKHRHVFRCPDVNNMDWAI